MTPTNDAILIYRLNGKGEYELDISQAPGTAHSSVLSGFSVGLTDLFFWKFI